MQVEDESKWKKITPNNLDLLYTKIKFLIEKPLDRSGQEKFSELISTLAKYLIIGSKDNTPLIFE